MKLATLKNDTRDGQLVVVSKDLTKCTAVPDIATTLQSALDQWSKVEPQLAEVYKALNEGKLVAEIPFEQNQCESPLPRAYQWADGSAYVNHVELVRKARGAEMPPSFWTDPLMYQGGSDAFIGPRDDIPVGSEEWGIDFEGEVAVITDDVPMGATSEEAANSIRLLMLVNDVSLRGLIPNELAKGFGFFQSKPSSVFSPVAVTPDELGDAWDGGKVTLPLLSFYNGEAFGCPNAGVDMTFEFPELVAHAAKTRPLSAGAIVGSGTVSNKQGTEHGTSIAEGGVGYSCIAEVRMIETIRDGKPSTSFMKFGDRIKMEMKDVTGDSIFGSIDQKVVKY
ncbi:fumarylacetoacetate hydrolase family protein [Vibrio coralliilyticus]|uniref:Fumarylacetoacetate hydrolase family protein n=1 Tax=Vibrio coralliilyticus TaxID=190893 RepID=A0AAE5LE57_9VIBR|nr:MULTISPECIES: fumarylacetoacetate hydrolase family protein [Vibrio]NOH54072.1 fumarylacetoacetate hydrolase family protein [Vibrio coralliilyticus]NOI27963.1 fumarylacetoacetate hydrolase family protein [Vibrio coralliilyticus]NOI49576.1 fumarylacetoacetate hydrolase family protein [Vibrio coralliilyticus]NOI75397.1 fumarylacetoacetate hydrolase family protein [Vibrio coralliilyticus]NOJ24712.1 fumarylacetoacetate hydrolase family protein [Vibrio coralliilyticus]